MKKVNTQNVAKCLSPTIQLDKPSWRPNYHVWERSKADIEQIDNEEYISGTELNAYLSYEYGVLIKKNQLYFYRNFYPVDLKKFVKKIKIVGLINTIFVKKKDIDKFVEFDKFYCQVRKQQKERAEFRKALKKFYGRPSDITKDCIKANYNCSECSHINVCKPLKTDVNQKQIAQMMHLFGLGRSTISIEYLLAKIEKLEKELAFFKTLTPELVKRYGNNKEKFDECIKNEEFQQRWNVGVADFTDRELEIIDLTSQGYKLKEIGDKYGITGNRVRQLREKAFRKIRTFLRLLNFGQKDL